MSELAEALRGNLSRVIRGKGAEIDLLIAAFIAGGNVLLTDVPGVGKTTLAKAFAVSVGGKFSRVQFTPDLLPADILGGSVYDPRDGTFNFRRGPIFANVVLADEVNRASPRTQSALLEAMAEGQVSIEGTTHTLEQPFWVVATQNPVEFHGTYPLPEAQLDRFALELELGYPPAAEEVEILLALRGAPALVELVPVAELAEVAAERQRVSQLHLDEDIARYVVDLLDATRREARVQLGASPRAGIQLIRMAQGHAAVAGRDRVLPDDVKAVAVSTLAHRLVLETKARYSGVSKRAIVGELLDRVRVPV